MWYRLVSIAIVAFCVVMTALLIRKVYHPELDRFPEVPVPEVMERFLGQTDTSPLYVYRNGRAVGDFSLIPQVDDEGGVALQFQARGEVALGGAPTPLVWRGALNFGPAPGRELKAVELEFDQRPRHVRTVFSVDPKTLSFYTRSFEKGVLVSDSRTDPAAAAAMLPVMMSAMGGAGAGGAGAGAGAGEGAGGLALQWTARYGNVELGGRRQSAYFLITEMQGAGRVVFTFTEVGELIHVSTDQLEYEAFAKAVRLPPDPLPYLPYTD